MKPKKRGIYFAIEGLDGSGKSTLVNLLSKKLSEEKFDFDIVSPTKVGNKNSFIEKIFHNSSTLINSRFARSFLYAHRSNLAAAKAHWNKQLIIGDRSIIITYVVRWNKNIFLQFLLKIFVRILEYRIPIPDYVIFLDASFETLENRLQSRTSWDIDENAKRRKQMYENYLDIYKNKRIHRLNKVYWEFISAEDSQDTVLNNTYNFIISKLFNRNEDKL